MFKTYIYFATLPTYRCVCPYFVGCKEESLVAVTEVEGRLVIRCSRPGRQNFIQDWEIMVFSFHIPVIQPQIYQGISMAKSELISLLMICKCNNVISTMHD